MHCALPHIMLCYKNYIIYYILHCVVSYHMSYYIIVVFVRGYQYRKGEKSFPDWLFEWASIILNSPCLPCSVGPLVLTCRMRTTSVQIKANGYLPTKLSLLSFPGLSRVFVDFAHRCCCSFAFETAEISNSFNFQSPMSWNRRHILCRLF